MNKYLTDLFYQSISNLDPKQSDYIVKLTDAILSTAIEAGASDIHLCPSQESMEMKWRIDGVLASVDHFPKEISTQVTSRIKVMSDLLTYQTETPQEGRIKSEYSDREIRISTFPTLFGEKTVIRLFAESRMFRFLNDLELPDEISQGLKHFTAETSGVILVTGPAGSGKTTTIYACLREILENSSRERSLVSLEDPIESVIQGVDQTQVNLSINFDMSHGLRSLLRQDPDVIMVGEIRDKATAETVFQASLSGHLVLTTFHAGSVAQSINRLMDMGIEPYLLRSGLRAVICQRLLRKLCKCSTRTDQSVTLYGTEIPEIRQIEGCSDCQGTGYAGRFAIGEMLDLQKTELSPEMLNSSDSLEVEKMLREQGMRTQWETACQAVAKGTTVPEEIYRVLGVHFAREESRNHLPQVSTEQNHIPSPTACDKR